ncbi:hypothetical protein F4820DRAFT_428436 [Hypoxylon rubiginosum]|uniref:Uncharacterized protein n=1 Tax=Hypoxylon rubiginosum TaxID=110542 RepID=A0ACB9YVP4_9PEZI|nr:hypothetical protein F4820DRAFT_428436 [Hypoxylon rubiginosum]
MKFSASLIIAALAAGIRAAPAAQPNALASPGQAIEDYVIEVDKAKRGDQPIEDYVISVDKIKRHDQPIEDYVISVDKTKRHDQPIEDYVISVDKRHGAHEFADD